MMTSHHEWQSFGLTIHSINGTLACGRLQRSFALFHPFGSGCLVIVAACPAPFPAVFVMRVQVARPDISYRGLHTGAYSVMPSLEDVAPSMWVPTSQEGKREP